MTAAAPSVVERSAVPPPSPPPVLGSASLSIELRVIGSIVDSWVEPAGQCDWDSRLILQISPRGRSHELVIAEADATLVPDLGWLADLAENLCHGSPVSVRLRRGPDGELRVSQLLLER